MTKRDLEAGGPRADRAKRRHFSADYKLRIVEVYDAAPAGGRAPFSSPSSPALG